MQNPVASSPSASQSPTLPIHGAAAATTSSLAMASTTAPAADFAALMQGAQAVGDGAGLSLGAGGVSAEGIETLDPDALALLQAGSEAIDGLTPEQAAAGVMFTVGGAAIATQSGTLSIAPLSDEAATEAGDAVMQKLMAEGDAARKAAGQTPITAAQLSGAQVAERQALMRKADGKSLSAGQTPTTELSAEALDDMAAKAAAQATTTQTSANTRPAAMAEDALRAALADKLPASTKAAEATQNAVPAAAMTPQAQTAIARITQAQAQAHSAQAQNPLTQSTPAQSTGPSADMPLTEAAYDPTAVKPAGSDTGMMAELKAELKLTTTTAQTPAQVQLQAQTAQTNVQTAEQPLNVTQLGQTQAMSAPEVAQAQLNPAQAAPLPRSLVMTDREWPTQLTAMIKEARDLTQGDIEIALQPERLGRMTIRMEMRENAVAVTIVTDNDASARLLNDNQARLADLMSKAGLDLSQHNASSGQQGGAQTGLGGQGGNGAPGQDQSDDTNSLATAQVLGGEAGQMNTADDDDGIDILA
ncbi:flagellar hook-length control protein FliK [Thalassobius sp. Cn5-15]|uniref:flagellar hook-length control protein FliK n=1 Tax=Thalassobius sp. Cn5-15 TaxID=2917763 RepID=UPI001EF23142|nr:flagellar hook-length control protein FliK [Thalassobius sp. Cn5-15]MCG7492817.1 flagellar hook-length control protein FliK [Thalassobius sp. Cn5-15]